VAGLFRAKWTDQIHDEWIGNLLKNRPDLTAKQLNRTRALMDSSVPDCLITGYEPFIESIIQPDANDRHVVAAAIHSGADAIVTFNLKDFPATTLDRFDKEVLHPDDFLHRQFGLDQAAVLMTAHRCRARLMHPPKTADEYLEILGAQSLPKLVGELQRFSTII
jgi:predicted nucleic acid-binding protein